VPEYVSGRVNGSSTGRRKPEPARHDSTPSQPSLHETWGGSIFTREIIHFSQTCPDHLPKLHVDRWPGA